MPNGRSGDVSDSFLLLLGLFASCCVLLPILRGLLPCLLVSLFVLFDCPFLETYSSLKRRKCGRGDEGSWETLRERKLVGIDCIKEESIFNKKRKEEEQEAHEGEAKGKLGVV